MIKRRSKESFQSAHLWFRLSGADIKDQHPWIHRAISILWERQRKLPAAADAAIIVVNGKNGVEVGTEKAWDLCEKYKLPRMFYVTNMD